MHAAGGHICHGSEDGSHIRAVAALVAHCFRVDAHPSGTEEDGGFRRAPPRGATGACARVAALTDCGEGFGVSPLCGPAEPELGNCSQVGTAKVRHVGGGGCGGCRSAPCGSARSGERVRFRWPERPAPPTPLVLGLVALSCLLSSLAPRRRGSSRVWRFWSEALPSTNTARGVSGLPPSLGCPARSPMSLISA